MRLRINKIKLENFKGIGSFEADFAGKDAVITAENGVGKTTVYDAFLWLLFGKDSAGRTAFGSRPVDTNPDSPHFGEPIKGLVVAVEAAIEVMGVEHVLRKEEHEHITKKQKVEFPARYWIDEVPQEPQKLYHEYVASIIPEDKFKMFTDLAHFNGKMKWEDRRKILCDMAGDVAEPASFDELIARLNGMDIKDYKKILTDRKKAHTKGRDEINPAIRENRRKIKDYVQDTDTVTLEAKRDILKESIADLDKERKVLLDKDIEREGHREHINRLTTKRSHRESVIKHQTGPVDDLLAERAELEKDHADKTQELVNLQTEISQTKTGVDSAQYQIDQALLEVDSLRKAKDAADSGNCPLDEQPCPLNKKSPNLSDIVDRSNVILKSIESLRDKKAVIQDNLVVLVAKETEIIAALEMSFNLKDVRIAEIAKAIELRPEPDPTKDIEWQGLTQEINKTRALLGEPTTVLLESIEAQRKTHEESLTKLNETLAQSDDIEYRRKRIIELTDQEKDLSQKIVTIEGQLDEIKLYEAAQNTLIEDEVNGMFEYVTYRLFYYHQNGEYEPCCVALLDGVPYPDMSAGEKIFAGIDVINTLGDHYGCEVTLFVDDAEHYTKPLEARSQVIQLVAQKGVKELQVEVEQKEESKAVA